MIAHRSDAERWPAQGILARGRGAAMLSPNSAVATRRLRSLAVRFAVACGIAVRCCGFVWFVSLVPDEEIVLDRNADGIVVLTGGASRVTDAIELLAAGRGKRLLISGVNPATTTSEIAPSASEYSRFLSLLRRSRLFGPQHARQRGRDAALGARPRLSLADRGDVGLPHAARAGGDRPPAARRRADPVPGGRGPAAQRAVVGERPTTRLVLSEYVKYVFAKVRMRIDP